MKKLPSLLFFLLITSALFAQQPDWTDFKQRQQLYPASQYFTGFSMQEVDRREDRGKVFEKIKKNAMSNLSNSIQVTVESVSTLNTLELKDEVHQQFREKLASFSRIDLSGIQTLTHYNKRNHMAYALAYVKKSHLIDYYRKLIGEKKAAISQKIKLAGQYTASGDNDKALKTYYQCMPLFTEVEEAQTIVILLEAAGKDLQQIKNYELRVKEAIAQLHKSEQLTLDDVCSFMAYSLRQQTAQFTHTIRLANFTFEDTKMGSAFSRRFNRHFEKELIQTAGYDITTTVQPPGQASRNPRYLLKGTYWDEGNKIKIIAILRDLQKGTPLATADGFLPKKWLQHNKVSWKPENFAQAHQNMLQFRKDEIVEGNMQLEVWTNKGNESPLYEENDTLGFYVRVNHPCYIRIINHFADGTRVLLVDNNYVGTDKVNKVVEIPQKFRCAPPFGAEVLQVNAQSEEFPPLATEDKWGYRFIKNDLDKILQNTRGFKPIKNEDLKAEKRIVVTTMEKN